MKKTIILSLALALMTLSCKKEETLTHKKNEVSTSQNGELYTLDTQNSNIEWKGFKIFKSENTSNFGKMKFERGELTVHNGKLESGKFIANINSLECENLKDNPESKKDLEDHLKSGDFFETEKFPTASYEITKVETLETGDYNTLLEGNLTIKGITKSVNFKANVSEKEGVLTLYTEPTDINREDFGVKFSIPIKNGVIKNEINLQIAVKAQLKK